MEVFYIFCMTHRTKRMEIEISGITLENNGLNDCHMPQPQIFIVSFANTT